MAEAKKSLVIVESPSKAKTINKYLGKNFKVAASVGHIIDLPKSRLGVNIEDGFKPQYIKIQGKQKIINQLKEEARSSDKIYLATDPDREGEAIAYHIASILDKNSDEIKRIEFNEITKNAITQAFETPRDIDMARVYSQQARRVLDRIVGYKVSPILWKTVYRGLSAGRVQSVALRLICERELEIRDFKPEEFWTIAIFVQNQAGVPFWARLVKIYNPGTKKFEKTAIKNAEEAELHAARIKSSPLLISELTTKRIKKYPSPPFITSTLQQTAARLFKYSTSRIMRIAQQLYEGINIPGKGSVGLITYMRTDSTRISHEALSAARALINTTWGSGYMPEKPQVYRAKKSAQDAHEAIRPTYLSPDFEPAALKAHISADQYKIYDLIWKRFMACQMTPALYDKTTVEIKTENYLFTAEGEQLVFDGYLKLYGKNLESMDENEEKQTTVPSGLHKDDALQLKDLEANQNFTKPPPRYTESSLVKELDQLRIGRPSTYAQIISTILNRTYVEKKENKLFATELGETVNTILTRYFPDIINVKFTAEMEEDLDKIADKKYSYEDTMQDFYQPFTQALEKVNAHQESIRADLQKETEERCDVCGRPMVIRWGRNGRFIACSGYPECKNTKPLEEESQQPQVSDEKCEKCGNPMLVKSGRFGKFLACSNYPACKTTRAIPVGVPCPRAGCGGMIVERRSKKGKVFYGCNKYPSCDFVSWYKPVKNSCPACANSYLLQKYSKVKGNYLECPECKHKVALKKSAPVDA
jgi:DNA topoisomerase-1